VPEFRDDNDRSVAGLLEAFDELMKRAETYQLSLEGQLAEVIENREDSALRHVERGARFAREFVALLDETVLEALMDMRNSQHHIYMSRLGKLV
jgi:hypothetical protein